MELEKFKYRFKDVNAAVFGDAGALTRRPLALVDFATSEITKFKSLDEALAYEFHGKSIAAWVEGLQTMRPTYDGGRGGGSGMDKTFKFGHAGGGSRGGGNDIKDLPAKLNVRVPIMHKSPEAVLDAFRDLHALSKTEFGITVDEQGFVTQYVRGGATSVGIWGKKGEMVYHNHPSGGAFSDSDLLSSASGLEKGIVASGKNGDYIFYKGGHFKAGPFMAAVKSATLKGKDYSDAVDKWLKKNQKKYGYTYIFRKAK